MKMIILIMAASILILACSKEKELSDAQLKEKASQLAQQLIIIDTHVDVPYRLVEKMADISIRTEDGHFDYPRARSGGLDAPFMSIYIPAKKQVTGGEKAYADFLIDMVEDFEKKWPDKFAVAKSTTDILEQQKNPDIISLPMGIENGAAIEDDLANLKHFYDRGIRYITLTHSKYNKISDSSYDKDKHWNGLSPFGKKVVAEMNNLGIMVDISHVSDSAFYQVLNITEVPVIASHSSCRAFTPDWERNMNDDMIKALAKNGGVIQINFGSAFINGHFQKYGTMAWDSLEAKGLSASEPEGKVLFEKIFSENNVKAVQIEEVIDHIDHVKELVGIDHIGLGSDFDGLSHLPTGLEDASTFPNLIYQLLKRGYTEEEIEKICSGNTLRVWKEAEEFASKS